MQRVSRTTEIRPSQHLPVSTHLDVDIDISTGSDLSELQRAATLVVRTGAVHVQTYLAASECRALAKALMEASMRVEVAIDMGQVPA